VGRSSKLLLSLISAVIFLGFSISVIIDINRPVVNEKSSEISFIENFSFKNNIDNKSYYSIYAKRAELFFYKNRVDFDNCTFYYRDSSKEIKGAGEKCVFEKDKNVIVENNIKGFYNSIEFRGGDKSIFLYDLVKNEGYMTGGVFAKDNGNSIRADKLRFRKDDVFVEFLEHVEVIYEK
jgi:hypothetical protein